MTFRIGSPRSSRFICSSTLVTRKRASDAAALCGVMVTRGCAHNGLAAGNGSSGNTSSVAPDERAFVERCQNVGVDLQSAPAHIDQVGAAQGAVAPQLAQQREIEQALGCRRERQQHHKDLAACEERIEACGAMMAIDAGN